MPLLKYSFALPPPAAPAPAPEARHEYPYSEFLLELPARWRQVPVQEDDTLQFVSDADGAALIISADFFDIPADKAHDIAEQVLHSRIQALQTASEGQVRLLHRDIRPHPSGGGLELSFAAAAEGEHVHLHLGYVTSRKVLNFSMVCQPGASEAIALFNACVPGFRPRLP
jgi:hypothetical protein